MKAYPEKQVVISGIGQSEIARPSDKSAMRLTVDAVLAAIADAGLTVADIDGIATWPGKMESDLGFGPVGVGELKEALGIELNWFSGGKETPAQFGAGRSSGSQHSQSLEALLAHIPGLSVVMPSTPADTYGLLRAAIQDPNPVVFIENRLLYGMKGPQPPADHILPIGKSAVVRPGRDVTVVSVSRMVHEAVAAAEAVAGDGISVEVIDLRTVAPLDLAPILESVAKTSRLLIAHEAVVPFGIGAEIAATVARDGFWNLDAPIERVGAAATPPPYSPDLERAWLPDRDDIADAIRRLAAA